MLFKMFQSTIILFKRATASDILIFLPITQNKYRSIMKEYIMLAYVHCHDFYRIKSNRQWK